MNKNKQVLIFSPHIDDEVLGCFSFLDQNAIVVYAGVESRVTISREIRIAELEASATALHFKWELLENPVNNYSCNELIAAFEEAINEHKPDTVLMPVRSYNQDHRAVHDAALVATRPHDLNWRVNRVLAFEQPHSEIWPYEMLANPVFHRIINIDDKLDAYAHYASQIRGQRSPETVSALAAMRGAQIGEAHAEAFHVMRWIDA